MSVTVTYRDAYQLTQEMLEYARQSLWEDLLDTEKKRAVVLSQLPSSLTETVLEDEVNTNEIKLLIQNIQACDEETTNLTRAWMDELGVILSSMDSQKKLQQVYGTQ